MNYWVTTDTHFGHAELIKLKTRPAKVDDLIMRNHWKIPPGDILIHLGDICWGNDAEWHALFREIPVRKWLVKGNHDKKTASWYLDHGWDFVCESFTMEYFGRDILFSHIPQYKTGYYDLNIHGHLHAGKHHHEYSDFMHEKNILLALENNNYRPYKLKTILEDRCRLENR